MSINSALLRSFADLKQEEKEIKKRVEDMKGRVLTELQSAELDEVTIPDMGVIMVVPKRTWKYPEAIVELEAELKKAKTDAEARGDATCEDFPFVRFDPLEI